MRGWVYIITNRSLVGLLKVGFSSKDPVIRAKELDGTGLPHPYKVEYAVLIESAHKLERVVHKKLQGFHDGKEWFSCSIPYAIKTIREAAETEIVLEELDDPGNDPSLAEPSKELDSDVHDDGCRNTSQKEKPLRTKKAKPPFVSAVVFDGACTVCHYRFKVTLSRYDNGAYCPKCRSKNDTSRLQAKQLI